MNSIPLAKMLPPMKIHLKPDAVPMAIHKAIPVPHYLRDAAEANLYRDVGLGILEKVPLGTPTKWLSRMVIVPKPGKPEDPRRTIYLKHLNSQCLRETHQTISPFHQVSDLDLNGYKTVMDAWSGYHALPLTEESKEYTTFLTPWGKFRYLRAPQGYLASGNTYTSRRSKTIRENKLGENSAECIDDTFLVEKTIEDNFIKTWKYLYHCSKAGITFNPKKFQFCEKKVLFAGLELSDNNRQGRLKPNPNIIEKIRN